jgi:hypothetical protein
MTACTSGLSADNWRSTSRRTASLPLGRGRRPDRAGHLQDVPQGAASHRLPTGHPGARRLGRSRLGRPREQRLEEDLGLVLLHDRQRQRPRRSWCPAPGYPGSANQWVHTNPTASPVCCWLRVAPPENQYRSPTVAASTRYSDVDSAGKTAESSDDTGSHCLTHRSPSTPTGPVSRPVGGAVAGTMTGCRLPTWNRRSSTGWSGTR